MVSDQNQATSAGRPFAPPVQDFQRHGHLHQGQAVGGDAEREQRAGGEPGLEVAREHHAVGAVVGQGARGEALGAAVHDVLGEVREAGVAGLQLVARAEPHHGVEGDNAG